jgi:hypothetical protein
MIRGKSLGKTLNANRMTHAHFTDLRTEVLGEKGASEHRSFGWDGGG